MGYCRVPLHGFEFSFINNAQSVTFTTNLLVEAGIPLADVSAWLGYVNAYNDRQAFISSNARMWYETSDYEQFRGQLEHNGLSWVNCRKGLFCLVRNLISVTNFSRKGAVKNNYGALLTRELNDFSRNTNLIISPGQVNAYYSLNLGIQVNMQPVTEKMMDQVLGTFKAYWAREGFSFPADPRIRIIQAVILNRHGGANNDHVALAVLKNGRIYLVEKISHYDPFTISVFKDYNEMGEYIYTTFKDWTSLMVLANDEIVWKRVNTAVEEKNSGK